MLVTADHGEMLGERGLWYKMHFFEWALRVPLIVRAPGRFAAAPGVASRSRWSTSCRPCSSLPAARSIRRCAGDGRSLVPLAAGVPAEPRPVLAEYTAEGALAPILMVRDGALKLIWSEADPPLLFDLDRDPRRAAQLAQDPAYAAGLERLVATVRQNWDPAALRTAVLASQRARRFTWPALMTGRHTSWDYQPRIDASQRYWRNTQSMDEMEAGRRWPPASPEP